MKNTFVEVCIYEVKPRKTDEFESLIEKVAKHHRDFPGVFDVKYIKRTHRQADFNAVRNGEPARRLVRAVMDLTASLEGSVAEQTMKEVGAVLNNAAERIEELNKKIKEGKQST